MKILTGKRLIPILLFGAATASIASTGETSTLDAGVGLDLISAYVIRDSTRGGAALQPSLWVYLPFASSMVSVRSSFSVSEQALDAVVADIWTGSRIGRRGWAGATLRWSRFFDRGDVLGGRTVEVGASASWFRPPYRPTVALSADVGSPDPVLTVFSLPYTFRLGWLPPLTVVPEIGVDISLRERGLSPRYISASVLMEFRWSRLTLVPVAGLIPSGTGIGDWIVWGGLHLGAAR
jgi:hypothetical protein